MNKLRALIWSYRGVSPLPYVTPLIQPLRAQKAVNEVGSSISDTGLCCGASSGALSCLQACLQSPLPGIVVTRGAGLANHNAALPACLCLYKKARTGPSEHTSTSTKSSTSTNRKWACNFPWSSIRTLEKTFPPLTLSCRQFLLDSFLDSFSLWSDFSFHFDFGTLLREKTSACSQLTLTFVDYPETVFL